MVKNIAIFSLRRKQSYEVGKLLAGGLDMSFLDTIELFEFDNAPRTQSTMIKEFGLKMYRKKFRSTIRYSSHFENTVINLDSSMPFTKELFDTIKENCLLIYLINDVDEVKEYKETCGYDTPELKRLYNVKIETIKKQDTMLKKYADIIIEEGEDSFFKISSQIIRKIKAFYKVK